MRHLTFRLLALLTIGLCIPSCIPRGICPPPAYEPACVVTPGDLPQDIIVESPCWIVDNWWELFEDETLNGLIVQTLSNNPQYHSAYERIDAAEANAYVIQSQLFPQINLGGNVQRQKLSKTGIIPAASPVDPVVPIEGAPGIPFYFTQYEVFLNFAYDFDIWGQRRSNLKAALGEVQSRIADEGFVRLELTVAVAQAYLLLQIAYQRQEIYEKLVGLNKSYFEFVKARMYGNIDNATLANNAMNQIAAATQLLDEINLEIDQYRHQLQALVGDDYCLQLPKKTLEKLPKLPIPCDVPLHLVGHRPDIVSQLWVIQSMGNLVDAAIAGYYPDFNLTALGGFQTIHLRKFFEARSFYGFIGPAFNLPVFDGGNLDGNLMLSTSNERLAILEYNKLLIDAVQEVLDGLSRVKWFHHQHKELEGQHSLLSSNYDLVQQRIANNIGSEMDRIPSEISVLTSRDRSLQAMGNTLKAILYLIKALGGGYESPTYCEGLE